MAMTCNLLTPLTRDVRRIENCGMAVDLVNTSMGTVRVGGMPDISKFLNHHGFREEMVVVPDWTCSMAGDNRTGEEFVLWQAQVRGGLKKLYVGAPKNLEQIYTNLDDTFSYFFDDRRISIIKKKWLNRWFSKQAATPAFEMGSLTILVDRENVIISDHGKVIYDKLALKPADDADTLVESLLSGVLRDGASRSCIEVTPVGTGNGFSGTVASAIVRFAKEVVWIDPCGYPAHALARHNIHWDDITHILVTHNHEDHIQGFSACLKRAEHRKTPINLITAQPIFNLLKQQFTPLIPGFDALVNFIPITPGSPLMVGSLKIESRWNHHFLPYGTLGLKFSGSGKTFGFSGDTKFDEAINELLNREELLPRWFAECDLVFHETDFDNPASVHSHWKEVQKLQQAIPGRVLGDHTPFLANAPLALVEEGKIYCL